MCCVNHSDLLPAIIHRRLTKLYDFTILWQTGFISNPSTQTHTHTHTTQGRLPTISQSMQIPCIKCMSIVTIVRSRQVQQIIPLHTPLVIGSILLKSQPRRSNSLVPHVSWLHAVRGAFCLCREFWAAHRYRTLNETSGLLEEHTGALQTCSSEDLINSFWNLLSLKLSHNRGTCLTILHNQLSVTVIFSVTFHASTTLWMSPRRDLLKRWPHLSAHYAEYITPPFSRWRALRTTLNEQAFQRGRITRRANYLTCLFRLKVVYHNDCIANKQ